jgi:hypothetical protein
LEERLGLGGDWMTENLFFLALYIVSSCFFVGFFYLLYKIIMLPPKRKQCNISYPNIPYNHSLATMTQDIEIIEDERGDGAMAKIDRDNIRRGDDHVRA